MLPPIRPRPIIPSCMAGPRRGITTKARRAQRNSNSIGSMPEVADAREHHRQPVLIAGRDRVAIADRPARLHDRDDARLRRRVDVVSERKERVGSEDTTFHPLAGLPYRDLDG